MNAKPSLEDVASDLAPLKALEVVLFASFLTDRFTPRSDIDVAVVTRGADRGRNKEIWHGLLGRVPDRYDVRVFELLPLTVQHGIVESGRVLFGDRLDLSEYFYRFRRAWKALEPRVRANQQASVAGKWHRLQAAKAQDRGKALG